VTTTINVLLADDHALVRRGFRRLLEDDPALRVVGEASTGDEAIALAATLVPDVIVMDAAMPGTNGLQATKAIVAARPGAVVLMLSMHSEDTLVRQALDAGARGYILKDALDLDLAAAVKRAVAGEMVLDPKLTPQTALKGEREHGLSPRELEVLRLIREEEPPRPSTRLTDSKEHLAAISEQRKLAPAQLMKQVRGDLDWIVMKALEKDRTRRYETANGLAADLKRHLSNEAVVARPPTPLYRPPAR
jgi:DNA-binding NarL/FixJ family response regulator